MPNRGYSSDEIIRESNNLEDHIQHLERKKRNIWTWGGMYKQLDLKQVDAELVELYGQLGAWHEFARESIEELENKTHLSRVEEEELLDLLQLLEGWEHVRASTHNANYYEEYSLLGDIEGLEADIARLEHRLLYVPAGEAAIIEDQLDELYEDLDRLGEQYSRLR